MTCHLFKARRSGDDHHMLLPCMAVGSMVVVVGGGEVICQCINASKQDGFLEESVTLTVESDQMCMHVPAYIDVLHRPNSVSSVQAEKWLTKAFDKRLEPSAVALCINSPGQLPPKSQCLGSSHMSVNPEECQRLPCIDLQVPPASPAFSRPPEGTVSSLSEVFPP